MSAMFIFNQRWIAVFSHVLLLVISLVPQTIRAEEFTVLLPGGVPMTLVEVPAGTFQMGSPEGERGNILGNEKQHQVTVTRDYYLGKTEITGRQWWAVMGTPHTRSGCPSSANDEPVSGVNVSPQGWCGRSTTISPDGKWLVDVFPGITKEVIRVYDVKMGSVARKLNPRGDYSCAARFSPNGKQFLITTEKVARLYETQTWTYTDFKLQ